MAGQMGNKRSITTQNLEIVAVDDNQGIILIEGAVPGSKNGWVYISDAFKKARPDEAPFPAGLYSDATEDATSSEDMSDEVIADVNEAVEASNEGASDEN